MYASVVAAAVVVVKAKAITLSVDTWPVKPLPGYVKVVDTRPLWSPAGAEIYNLSPLVTADEARILP
jgi:hypothetical protein